MRRPAPRRFAAVLALAVGLAMLPACSNVVPAEIEQRMADQKAKAAAHERAIRELWVLETTRGQLVVRLFPKEAPKTVAQVRAWTEAGAYDGTWIHRAVREPRPFVIQGGDPDSAALVPASAPEQRHAQATTLGFGTTEPALAPEATKRLHTPGAVALAVAADGSRAGPQFVLTLDTLPHLDGTEPVFGQLEGGWSVVRRLEVGDRIVRARLLPPERIAGEWFRDVPVTGP